MRGHAGRGTPDAERSAEIEVHIESLVLHGFSPLERYRVAEAVRLELARLLREGGVPLERAGEVARLDAGAFTVAAGAGAEQVGAQVARAVYRGLSPRPEGGKEP
jgi:hypothetical protein